MNRLTLKRILRFFLSLAGVCLILYSLADERFYDLENTLRASFALVFSSGIGLLLLSLFPSRAGFWLMTGLVGQAALLQMIDAGKRLHYQHYRFQDSTVVVWIILAAQTLLVSSGIWKHRALLAGWIHRHAIPIVLCMLVIAPVSAAVSEDPSFYIKEFTFAFFASLVQLANVFLIVRNIRTGFFLRRFHQYISKSVPTIKDRFVVGAAVWVIVAAILLSVFVYERHPHVNDELIYLWQARILAQLKLTIDPPPVPEAFEVYLIDYSGDRMFVVPPPGWPAILAIGVWLKAPWLINPLLAGLNVLLASFVLGHLYNRRIARISILLLCVSPWFVFMSMNFMTHQWTTTCALVTAAGVIQSRRTGKNGPAFVAGIFLGIQSLIRPLDALIFGIVIGAWIIGIGGRRLRFSATVAFAIGTLLTGSLIFPYNHYFTGDPFTYPINLYNDRLFGKNANAYGFGKDHGMEWPLDPLPGHGPLDASINAQLNSSQIHVELFGWSTGSLWLFVALFAFLGFQRRDLPSLAVIGAVFTAYFFYYFSGGPDFGARYWFMMILPIIALSVRGMETLQERIHPNGIHVFVGGVILCFFALINYFPWRSADKYHHYLGMRPEICSIPAEHSSQGDLVLIQGEKFPDFASGMACNPLDFLHGNPVYAWDRSPEVRKLLEMHYPGRKLHVVLGPSLTGAGYGLVFRSDSDRSSKNQPDQEP